MYDLSKLSLDTYERVYSSELPDLASEGLVLRHKKSGARICLVANDDNNKVFYIGFRTPPFDSTGVAHIIEHTVLCGSERFPLKDPFIELCKGSLNTFLNAMTYPDKTLYPLASCNDQDFRNLMDVYMDAVFHPNIYKYQEIFKQEGWHYELASRDAELTINGVVYSEMKGAFSSDEEVLYREIQKNMFPDTSYGVESGGDPKVIPELTYEQYLDFHRRYYHPSNSYICLYGDMDMEEQLTWLDERYLSAYDYQPVDSEVKLQKPYGTKRFVSEYPIGDEDSEENKTYLSFNTLIGRSGDIKRCTAWDILLSVLLDVPGAPVKQALIDAGIGSEIMCDFGGSIQQPMFSIIARDAREDQLEEFLKIIREELEKQVKNGINRKSLLGAINNQEFRYREADYGSYPKGLIFLLNMATSWLYDDNAAFGYCQLNPIFKELREQIDTGYFEQLIQEDLLDSKHVTIVTLNPSKGMIGREEASLAKKLADYKATLSDEELDALIADTKALREYQEAEESEETAKCLPVLSISDIEPKTEPFSNIERDVDGTKVLYHDVFTNGISYLDFLFDVGDLPEEEYPYLGLLVNVLGLVDTEDRSYLELSNETNIHTGGIAIVTDTYTKADDRKDYRAFLQASMKVLYAETGAGLELLCEALTRSKLGDTKRLREIIAEGVSKVRSQFESGGHVAAVNRAASYFSAQDYFNQQVKGIAFYDFLKSAQAEFEEKKDEIVMHLTSLAAHIMKQERLVCSLTAEEAGYEALAKALPTFVAKLEQVSDTAVFSEKKAFVPNKKNEGITFAGQVQYLATCGNYKDAGLEFTGALLVSKTILSLDYLWNNIRVKGGAYGCMCDFSPISGNAFFVSYRDPKLAETEQVYLEAADYFENLKLTQTELEKYVIGTFSTLDTPRTPKRKGARALNMYMTGYTLEDLQKERDEALQVTVDQIKATAKHIRAMVEQKNLCALGSESKVKADKELFLEIRPLS